MTPSARVVLRQPAAKACCLGPHDRIPFRVVIGTATEDFVSDHRLLEFLVASLEMAIDEKRQESRHAGVSQEPGPREDVREFGTDFSGGRLDDGHQDSKNRPNFGGATNV